MRRKHIFGFIMLLTGGLLFTGCHKEYFKTDRLSDEMEIEPELVLPLINGSMSMEDLTEVIDSTSWVLEDEEGLSYYLLITDTIYSVEETIEADFTDSDLDGSMVTGVQINLRTVNELAIQVELQVYLEDENHVVLDSLFDNNGVVLNPARIDSDGKLIEATEDENSATFDSDKVEMLNDVAFTRMSWRMLAANEGEDFVKIYATYSLAYEMSIWALFRLNSRDLN
jgi:hypothetical protein